MTGTLSTLGGRASTGGRACRDPAVEPVETPAVVEPVETPAVEPVETLAVEPVETLTPAVEPVETLTPAVEPVETRRSSRRPGGRACRDPHPAVEPVETLPGGRACRDPHPGGRACRDPDPGGRACRDLLLSTDPPSARMVHSPDSHSTRPTRSRARSSAWLGPTSSNVQTAPTTSGVRRTSRCASMNIRRVEAARTPPADARSNWFGPRSSRESPKPSGWRSRSRTGLARSAKHSSRAGSLICPPSLVDGRGGPRGGRGLDRLDHRGSTGWSRQARPPTLGSRQARPPGARRGSRQARPPVTGSTTGRGLDRLDHRVGVSTGSTTG